MSKSTMAMPRRPPANYALERPELTSARARPAITIIEADRAPSAAPAGRSTRAFGH
jgi:hypothetical protein